MDWMQEIRHLYLLNDLRTAHTKGSPQFLESQQNLNAAVSLFKKKAEKQREDKRLAEPCRKALESLDRHWHGLTTFIRHLA
jgi:hypothetical protein